MGIDPDEFRRSLGQFASGVPVVTTRDKDGQPHGLTASSFCSVSLDPPLVLVCIDRRSETHDGFEASHVFGISVLREDQEHFSQRFSQSGREKFAARDLHLGEVGVALVPGALAHIECRVVSATQAGDHTIYVGEVVRLAVAAGQPLLFHASEYGRLDGGKA